MGCDTGHDTRWDTPPIRLTAPAVKKGGSLPSSPFPLARIGRAGLGRKTPISTGTNGKLVCDTPPLVFVTPPPLSVSHQHCPRH